MWWLCSISFCFLVFFVLLCFFYVLIFTKYVYYFHNYKNYFSKSFCLIITYLWTHNYIKPIPQICQRERYDPCGNQHTFSWIQIDIRDSKQSTKEKEIEKSLSLNWFLLLSQPMKISKALHPKLNMMLPIILSLTFFFFL